LSGSPDALFSEVAVEAKKRAHRKAQVLTKRSNPQKPWLQRPVMNAPAPKREREAPSAVAERLGMPRLLNRREVEALTNLSYVSIWSRMQTAPPSFPRSRIEGGRSVWLSSEVEDFIRNLPTRQLKADKAKQTDNH
jgi:predicted DNA-binding transcriptional regulator AlpA